MLYEEETFIITNSMTAHELLQKLILGELTISQGLALTKVLYKDILTEESYQWICNELEHYDDPKQLPDYRILDCNIIVVICGPYIGKRSELLDTSCFNKYLDDSEPYASPNKMLIQQNLESLEQSIQTDASTVQMELGRGQIDLLMQYYSYPSGCRIERMYQECRIELVRNIIPCVRNRLVNILQTEVLPRSQSQIDTGGQGKKTVFISYGWDDEEHCKWVRLLADRLSEHFDVKIDVKLPLGAELNAFMEQMISKANRVLLILTPKYKEKADARQNGVGYESVLISSELYKNQGSNKFIPIIRKGNMQESYPIYLGTRKGLDLKDDNLFENQLAALIEDIKRN